MFALQELADVRSLPASRCPSRIVQGCCPSSRTSWLSLVPTWLLFSEIQDETSPNFRNVILQVKTGTIHVTPPRANWKLNFNPFVTVMADGLHVKAEVKEESPKRPESSCLLEPDALIIIIAVKDLSKAMEGVQHNPSPSIEG